jgi:hypothetical protein
MAVGRPIPSLATIKLQKSTTDLELPHRDGWRCELGGGGLFLATFSHALRTPSCPVIVFRQNLLEKRFFRVNNGFSGLATLLRVGGVLDERRSASFFRTRNRISGPGFARAGNTGRLCGADRRFWLTRATARYLVRNR